MERPGPASLGVGGGGGRMASVAFTPAYINSLLGLVFMSYRLCKRCVFLQT